MAYLPVIDLLPLTCKDISSSEIHDLSENLGNIFEATAFAYLVNPTLTFSHDDVFNLA